MAALRPKGVADHTKYHLAPQGFWKKFRDAVVVSPNISSGLPIASVNRYPQPGSRPEKYATPATKASDPAQNPYWKRDVRRAYPRLSVVQQEDLSKLLIMHSGNPALSTPKSSEAEKGDASVPAPAPEAKELTAAIASVGPVFSAAKLPPSMPVPFKRWRPVLAEDAPHDPHAYFPMLLYK